MPQTIGIFDDAYFQALCAKKEKSLGIDALGDRDLKIHAIYEPVISFYMNDQQQIVPVTHLTEYYHEIYHQQHNYSIPLDKSEIVHNAGVLDHQLFNAPIHFVKNEFGDNYKDISKKLSAYTEQSLIEAFVPSQLCVTKSGDYGISKSFIERRACGSSG